MLYCNWRCIKCYWQIDNISSMNNYYWSTVFKKFTFRWPWQHIKFFKIFLTDLASTLCKTKSSHLLRICLKYFPVVLIPRWFFGHGIFCSNKSANCFEKNLLKYLHSSLNQRRRHRSPLMIFYFRLSTPLEGIPTDFKVR